MNKVYIKQNIGVYKIVNPKGNKRHELQRIQITNFTRLAKQKQIR